MFSDLALGAEGVLQDRSSRPVFSAGESDTAGRFGARRGHKGIPRLIKVIDVRGEEPGRPNVAVTDGIRGNFISNSSATCFNLKMHFASTTMEAM